MNIKSYIGNGWSYHLVQLAYNSTANNKIARRNTWSKGANSKLSVVLVTTSFQQIWY